MIKIFKFCLFSVFLFCLFLRATFSYAEESLTEGADGEESPNRYEIGIGIGVGFMNDNLNVSYNGYNLTNTNFAVNGKIDFRVNLFSKFFLLTSVNMTHDIGNATGNYGFYRIPIMFGYSFHIEKFNHLFIAPLAGMEITPSDFVISNGQSAFYGLSNAFIMGAKVTYFLQEKHKISATYYFGFGTISEDRVYVALMVDTAVRNAPYFVNNLTLEYIYQFDKKLGFKLYISDDIRTTIGGSVAQIGPQMSIVNTSINNHLFHTLSLGCGFNAVF